MAERFYTNLPLAPGPAELRGPEAHHLAVVCRATPGTVVTLFNGDGCEYPAEVIAADKKRVVLEVLSQQAPARELGTHVVVAAPLPKGDRADVLIEKLTELGVSEFIPLRTQRSVVHPHESKLERLQRGVIEASKQCGRNVLLTVQPLLDVAKLWSHADLPTQRLLAHPTGTARLDPRLSVAFAVGPEGGWTDAEVSAASAAGWQTVGLGPRILRVETAALTLASWASGVWG
jgi:16S rRNA (uracil1498-N3)-methyltransferase